jgi:probable rRNA maturation factor
MRRQLMIKIDIKDMQSKVKVDRKFIRKIVRETLKREGRGGEVSLVIADNAHVRELNRKYRSVDKPTDVLAFPMDDSEVLGDIVISVDKAEEQAHAYRQSFEQEMARLIVHGVLHLLGYADGNRRQKKKMHERQEQILRESSVNHVYSSSKQKRIEKIVLDKLEQ